MAEMTSQTDHIALEGVKAESGVTSLAVTSLAVISLAVTSLAAGSQEKPQKSRDGIGDPWIDAVIQQRVRGS